MIVLKHSFVRVFTLLHVTYVSLAIDFEITPVCTKYADDDLKITDFAYQNLWRMVTDESGTQENGSFPSFTFIKVKMSCFATDFTAIKQGTVDILEKKRLEIDRLITGANSGGNITLAVGFAVATEHITSFNTTGLHVMFDNIILNDGDAYKNVSGEFVTPDDATYQFQLLFSSLSEEGGGGGGGCVLHMQVNGSVVKSLTEWHTERKVAALSAILTLKAGSSVRVAIDYNDGHKNGYITFSGYTLH